MLDDSRIVLAGFVEAGQLALRQLLSLGCSPDRLFVLTHELNRNEHFRSQLEKEGIAFTTESVDTQYVKTRLSTFEPSFLLSAYYREIIPKEILNLFPDGAVNVHPSLLPEYAGTFSIPWMILNDAEQAGFTYHYMTEEVDEGPIVLQEPVEITSTDTAYSLYHRVLYAALSQLPQALRKVIVEGNSGRQQEGDGSYYPRRLPHDGVIDTDWDDAKIERFIRAMYFPPFDPAIVEIDGNEHKIVSFKQYQRLMNNE